MKKIIAVDTGNKCIKTINFAFVSGLSVSEEAPPFAIDHLWLNGKCYSLNNDRTPYKKDKTVDDTYYVLTLMAIAKELELEGTLTPYSTHEIILAVGLPPKHLSQLGNSFKEYFLRGKRPVKFKYNGVTVTIIIDNVYVYPQGISAIILRHDEIKQYLQSCIVDIGGRTTDIIVLQNGQPYNADACYSLERGLVDIYNKVSIKAEERLNMTNVSDNQIDEIIKNPDADYPNELKQLTKEEANKFLNSLISKLVELKIDTMLSPCIFIGGGSCLLKKYILTNHKIAKPIFVDDIKSNAIGYFQYTTALINK